MHKQKKHTSMTGNTHAKFSSSVPLHKTTLCGLEKINPPYSKIHTVTESMHGKYKVRNYTNTLKTIIAFATFISAF